MDTLTIAPIIALLTYMIIELIKSFEISERLKKHLPVIAAFSGGVLGIIAYFVAPQLVAAGDILTALAIGIISGLAATGSNQIYKQLFVKVEQPPSDDCKKQ